MLVLSRKEMQEADRRMIEHFGVPGIVLMEHAAIAMVTYCKEDSLILCGSGNNGGDGFALARLLQLKDRKPRVLLFSDRPLRGDAEVNRNAAERLGVSITLFTGDFERLRNELSQATMIVDCIFGIGLNRKIGEPLASAIAMVNESGLPIVSCDIPSGLDADTGEEHGISVHADVTITFHAMKRGLINTPNVEVVDIGIAKSEE